MHHIVVYLCSNLDHTHVGASSECDNANIDVDICRGGGTIMAAWAVGGEVRLRVPSQIYIDLPHLILL